MEQNFFLQCLICFWGQWEFVEIQALKARNVVTKLDLTIIFLFFWCIDINLSIQPMSLTLYMIQVY